MRGGRLIRRTYALLIAFAITIVIFHEFTSQFGIRHDGSRMPGFALHGEDVVWALPAIAMGAAIGAGLVVASGSRTGVSVIERLNLPGLGRDSRARSIGLVWGAIAVLAVHFTGAAFDVVPGGPAVVAVALGSALGFGTYRLHRHAMEHEAYRTFNLVAMLLATGSLASMSITPTGEWWTRNFSTLGTSDDIAAACFNVAVILSGAGMAGMSASLTRALLAPRFGVRRGGLITMRALIVVIGVSLMGVGLMPIDGPTDLHNAAALSAAAAFAVLCVGVQAWARSLPRELVAASYASIGLEVTAMVLYDVVGVFNLTVFEVVAFALVFAWLIALVAITHANPDDPDAAGRRHLAPTRQAPHPGASHDAAAGRTRPATRSGGTPTRRPPARSARRSGALRDVQRALRRAGDGADEPPGPG
ncbi:hypothetical protein GCM10023152_20580 [Agromyces bauzanensis]|uniref:DUF998 domain-containing protein n=2 Tax=Agromyces bauzanensis TaxID=1308924 RepID=A0A917PN81_9MICO|nr:hypothetical protein [Agromyces bauzanensis]GGJ85507.1 hypothetical protein GCM10011372_24760 [Agromyces bauzanensis]